MAVSESDAYVRIFAEVFDEIGLLADSGFQALPIDERLLVTRLFIRVHKWVPEFDLLRYLPLEALQTAISHLVHIGWLRVPQTVHELVEAASTRDLAAVAAGFGSKAKNRLDCTKFILSLCARKQFFGRPLADKVSLKLRALNKYYILDDQKRLLLHKAIFLFLLPSHGEVDTIVRANMKLISFGKYEYLPQKERPLFGSVEEFDEFYAARLVCDQLEDAKPDVLEVVPLDLVEHSPVDGGRYSPAYVFGRAKHLIAQLYGKLGDFAAQYRWVNLYLDQNAHVSKKSENFIRKLLLELRFFKEQKEVMWLHRGLNTYYDALETLSPVAAIDMQKKATKLEKELKNAGIAAPKFVYDDKIAIPVVDIEASQNQSTARTSWGADSITVEQTALFHYGADGWEGGHFENGVITTIFSLIFYEALFGDQENFRNRFQSRPLNMQAVLNACEDQLEGDLIAKLVARHDELSESEPMTVGVNWSIPLDGLVTVCRGLGDSLKPVLERLKSNYALYSSGFPDLSLWKNDDCMFVEVKSTNDIVSDNQYVWMKFLTEHNVKVEICKVRGAKRKLTVTDS